MKLLMIASTLAIGLLALADLLTFGGDPRLDTEAALSTVAVQIMLFGSFVLALWGMVTGRRW